MADQEARLAMTACNDVLSEIQAQAASFSLISHRADLGSVPDWMTALATPDWITALATVFGVVAAILGACFAYAQLTALKAEATQRRDEARQDQASKVAAWLDRGPNDSLVAFAINSSPLPIYRVSIGFRSPNHQNEILIGVLSPTGLEPTVLNYVTIFINNQRRTYPNIDMSFGLPDAPRPLRTLQTKPDGSKEWVEQFQLGPVGLTITFDDASGVRWERELDGSLHERAHDYKPLHSAVLG